MIKSITTIAITLLAASSAMAQKKNDIELQNHTIEFVKEPIDIAITIPQLHIQGERASENLQKLQSRINNDACVSVQNAVKLDKNSTICPNTTNLELLELNLMVEATAHANTFQSNETPYRLYSDWMAFANKHMASIFQKIYFFGGGANPVSYVSFNNYDLSTGEKIDIEQNIHNKEQFMGLVAKHFCKERKLELNSPQLLTGLNVELEDLPFPAQIGLTKKGIVVLYQQSEVAPSSFGVVAVTIPSSELRDVVGADFFEVTTASGGSKLYNQRKRADQKSR